MITPTTSPSWNKSQAEADFPPQTVAIGFSRGYAFFSLVLHTLATLSMLYSTLSIYLIAPTLLALLFSLIYSLRCAFMDQQIVWHANNFIELTTSRCSTPCLGYLSKESYHSSWIVLLFFKQENGRQRQCVITVDSVTTRDFRRLRSRLQLMSSSQFE